MRSRSLWKTVRTESWGSGLGLPALVLAKVAKEERVIASLCSDSSRTSCAKIPVYGVRFDQCRKTVQIVDRPCADYNT